MAFELIKVSELPELTTPSDPNVLPIQDGDYLKRISFENLKEAVTGDVADDLAAEVTAREGAISGEATARGNADTAILADLASPYSASATYAVGDYCTKDGQLYRCTTAITTAEAWTSGHWSAVALGNDTRDLRSALNDKTQNIVDVYSKNLADPDDFTDGELSADGTISASTGRFYTGYMAVEAGQKIRMGIWNGSAMTTGVSFNRVAAYNADKEIQAAKGTDSNSFLYTVPDGISFIRVTTLKTYITSPNTVMFAVAATTADFPAWEPYYEPYLAYTADFLTNITKQKIEYIQAPSPLTKSAATLTNGEKLSFSAPNTMRNTVYGLDADVTSFDAIYFGRDRTKLYSAYIKIDNTNVTAYMYNTQLYQHAHGLADDTTQKIEGHISVTIISNSKGTGKVTISTSKGIYTSELFNFGGPNGDVILESSNTSLTNVNISFFSTKWDADYIIYWESYEDYISKWMVDEGANNVCFDAVPGRTVNGGKTSFDLMMEIYHPKTVVWLIGGNNSDSSTAVNASWDATRQYLDQKCAEAGIELIYGTVPNSPLMLNTFKNAIIKDPNNHYKYIDIAAAVGAEEANSTWYTGMLSNDNIHPTSLGAKVIANCICSQLSGIIE